MTDDARHERNRLRIVEMYPWFGERVALVIRDLEAAGFRPRCQDTWRSPKVQLQKFFAGLSKVQWGFHCATSKAGKPEALAVDLLDDDDVTDDGQANISRGLGFLFALARSAKQHHLSTGIDWGLPGNVKLALWTAIAANNLAWPITAIGWDAFHVEVTGLTVSQARKGARPS